MPTVFLAAFIAGGTAAVAVNRFVDVARTQAQPTVECEPIFVALRSLPAGSPVTVWDVKLHEWPKAMVPAAAMRPDESGRWCNEEERLVAKVAIREGQPVLKHHLDGVPIAATASNTPSPIVPVLASPEAAAADTTEAIVAPSAILADADATPTPTPTAIADGVAGGPTQTEPQTTSIAAEEPPTAPIEDLVAGGGTSSEATPATGEGWPTAAEASTGGEAAMRFLVVPERIAILADELTARAPAKKDVEVPKPQAAPRTPSPQTLTGQPPRSTPPSPAMRQRSTPTKTTPGRTNAVQANPSAPTAEPVRRTAKPQQPTANRASPARSASVAPPRVRVEPEAEAEVPDADDTLLKSVFPNMAAGLEKIESEMVRIRRERFGAIFGTDGDTTDSPETNRRPR
jgi:hypothetical protein